MTPTLSTGQPSTLGVWRDLTAAVFGGTSAAVAFLDAKIAEQGRDESVLADEGQMLYVLTEIHSQPMSKQPLNLSPAAPPETPTPCPHE